MASMNGTASCGYGSEASAAVRGVHAYEADAQVLVTEAHAAFRNLLPELLDRRAELLRGDPKPDGMMAGLAPDVDAILFIGYHGKAGTARSVMSHTISGGVIADVRCDGRSAGWRNDQARAAQRRAFSACLGRWTPACRGGLRGGAEPGSAAQGYRRRWRPALRRSAACAPGPPGQAAHPWSADPARMHRGRLRVSITCSRSASEAVPATEMARRGPSCPKDAIWSLRRATTCASRQHLHRQHNVAALGRSSAAISGDPAPSAPNTRFRMQLRRPS